MKRILLFSLFVLAFSTLAAQDDDTSGWTVEQRCVGEPTAPPEGWTFDGTILMTGYAGIHAVQADWETPRVVVFLNEERDLPGGALSPDGRWYASPWGHMEITESYNTIVAVDEIWVYSTESTRQEYRLDLGSITTGWAYSQLYWLNNERLLVEIGVEPGIIEANPFTGETTAWEDTIPSLSGSSGDRPHPSPDWTRVVYPYWRTTRYVWGVFTPSSGMPLDELPLAPLSRYDNDPALAWMPDSTHFAAEIQSGIPPDYQFTLFDNDGAFVSTIFDLVGEQRIRREYEPIILHIMKHIRNSIAWSPDGRYLAFNVGDQPYPLETNLYIADFQEQIVVDTCIITDAGLAWSPDGTQLALMAEGFGQRPILVYDLAENQLFTVGYHSGNILAWRTNDQTVGQE